MSDEAALVERALEDARHSLTQLGYAVTNDRSIGMGERFREHLGQNYFNDEVLRHDEGDWPVDRKRARDVVRYCWFDGDLEVEEHDTITIRNRAGIAGDRDHQRVPTLKDPQGERLVRALLNLVPIERRQSDGTAGINLFRTFTNVVTSPHHDNEEFIILYVVDRVGDGAESYLYEVGPDGQAAQTPALEYQLNPGQILIFEDRRFLHGATPLIPPPGAETGRRDAIVCTIDYHSTYLEPAAAQA